MASEAPKWAAKLDLNEHRSRVVSGHHVVSSSPKQVSIGGRVNKRAAEFMEGESTSGQQNSWRRHLLIPDCVLSSTCY